MVPFDYSPKNLIHHSYDAEPGKTTLYVRGRMPEGCTVQQLNEAVLLMENFISQFEEVELFKTSISDYKNAEVFIYFKPGFELGNFPYLLKTKLESKAIDLGGVDWSIHGVGLGFSNAIAEKDKGYQIILEGYSYELLYNYASLLKQELQGNVRVTEVDITSSEHVGTKVGDEFGLQFDDEKVAVSGISLGDFYSDLKDKSFLTPINPVYIGNERYQVNLVSDVYSNFNSWDFKNNPVVVNNNIVKMSQIGNIEKRKTGNDIYKKNQQYQLVVAYDLVGSYQLALRLQERHIEAMSNILPLGFSIRSHQRAFWGKVDKNQYYLILLIFVVIYFICSILLESLLQPLAIIVMIPISFIGVFLTFYIFEINFDQGGYTSLIMLSGLAISASLYILNDYNNFRKERPRISPIKIYLKAYHYKIIPILLTTLSTMFGLIPFIIDGKQEPFWFAFAAGSMGGLVFSLVAVLIYLPMLIFFRTKLKF